MQRYLAIVGAVVVTIVITALVVVLTGATWERDLLWLILPIGGLAWAVYQLTTVAIQRKAPGQATVSVGALELAILVGSLLLITIGVLAIRSTREPRNGAGLPSALVRAHFTVDEWEGLHTILLTDPVVGNQWTVSPEETDIRVDRKLSQPQLLLNLGFMDVLEMEQTSGSKNWPLFDASFDGSDWRYLAPYYTGEALPDGAQALFVRTNQRYPPGQYDEYVDFHLRVKSQVENQLVIRTEREILAGQPAAWGKIPTVYAGRPLQWELRVYLSRKDGGLFDPAKLKQIPIVVGWLDKEDLLDETRLPLRASNARLATSSLVVFRHDSVQVAGNTTLVVFVPAEFKEDIWCRVNLKVW